MPDSRYSKDVLPSLDLKFAQNHSVSSEKDSAKNSNAAASDSMKDSQREVA